jgi:hypothetical protein
MQSRSSSPIYMESLCSRRSSRRTSDPQDERANALHTDHPLARDQRTEEGTRFTFLGSPSYHGNPKEGGTRIGRKVVRRREATAERRDRRFVSSPLHSLQIGFNYALEIIYESLEERTIFVFSET